MSIRVTPSTGLVDGQVVEVEVTGLSGDFIIAQCDPDNVPGNTVHCRWQQVSSDDGVLTVPFTVEEEYDTNYRGDDIQHTRCWDVIDDCLLVVLDMDLSPLATAPIHFGPPRPDPAVTVTPSSGLRDGDAVQIEVVGFSGEDSLAVAQCESEVAAVVPDRPWLVYTACRTLDHAGGTSTIAEAWAWDGPDGIQAAHCGPEPGGCVVVAYGYDSGTLVTAPLTVEPSILALAPGDQEAGFPIHGFVYVPSRPGETVKVAQCAAPVRATARASRCDRAQLLTLDENGEAATTLTLVEQIASPHRTVPCTTGGCAVAVFTARGATLGSAPVVVHPPDEPRLLSVEPSVDLVEWQGVQLTITGTRNTFLRVALCNAAVVAAGRITDALCGLVLESHLGYDWPELPFDVAVTRQLVTEDGSLVWCGNEPGDCVFAVESQAGGDLTSVPISFTPPPATTLTPASGLLDRQPITLEATGLQAGTTYWVEFCGGIVVTWRGCQSPVELEPVVASPDGTVTTTVPAMQRLETIGGPVYCRRQCHVGLTSEATKEPTTFMPYAMAEGRLAAAPADGLTGGQLVTVSGTDLMSSYDGEERLLAQVGVWGLVQCGRAVADDLSLSGVYHHCAVPPGGGIVEVPSSNLSVQVEVQSSFDSLTGDPVDCTSASGACLLVLTRVEVDDTLSLHSTPITFAAS